jgi:hypothetical protein
MGDKKEMRLTPAALGALVQGDHENFFAAATPGGIEAQEAAGQKKLAANALLPVDGIKEVAEKLGFTYDPAIVDKIFVKASLPAGWKKVPSEHSMWSDLVDNKGVLRAKIFFKAAFYDYKAHITAV